MNINTMALEGKKIRIKDIANLAGVSPGTVDRVIHNRGQVTEENREKILNIIDELDYKPNLLARSLATKKTTCLFLFVPNTIPQTITGKLLITVSKELPAKSTIIMSM
ncbi:MAG: LacI family transcriptional regulator [Bacteroidales bacterium]|nr:LacI family transcriptional regulator [Bacteroidales bacterium]